MAQVGNLGRNGSRRLLDHVLASVQRFLGREDRAGSRTQIVHMGESFDLRTRMSEVTPMARASQMRILRGLNQALEAKDPGTEGHSRRVELHATRMATALDLTTSEIADLRLAASLHDIGKVGLPDEILNKPGSLANHEYARIQEHADVGAWMLSHVANDNVIAAVRAHHERWDGRGYPRGLKGEEIPLMARIIAVADTYDAITSTRPYRLQSDRNVGIDVLMDEAGTQVDPDCVHAFLMTLPPRIVITTGHDRFTISTGSR